MSEFSKNRSTLPPLVVLTPHDLCPSTWSSVTLPSAPVFDRLIRLARETLEELSKLVREGWTETNDIRVSWNKMLWAALWACNRNITLWHSIFLVESNERLFLQRMFRTPLDDFDVLIHLHRRHLPRSHQAVDGMVTGCSHRMLNGCGRCTHLPVVDFDPAQIYLKELEVCVVAVFSVLFVFTIWSFLVCIFWLCPVLPW